MEQHKKQINLFYCQKYNGLILNKYLPINEKARTVMSVSFMLLSVATNRGEVHKYSSASTRL